MQNPAKKFIDLLESQQLLSSEIIDELRRQIADSKSRLSPELLAKLLVDNGHLTKFQATKIIAQFSAPIAAGIEAEVEEELGLASEYGSTVQRPASNVAEVFIDDEEIVDVEAVDDDVVDAQLIDDAIDVDVVPVEVEEVVEVIDEVDEGPVVAVRTARPRRSQEADTLGSSRPSRPVKRQAAKANPFDSFRILGVGLLLALVLIGGFFLVNFFLRGNADEHLKRADSNYEQRSYETAANIYKEFPENFPTHEKVSYTKVRNALARLRKDAEGAPDPTNGLRTALEFLPPVAEEPGLPEQQSDLAGALVALAQKFIDRADTKKGTDERRALMADMDKLMELIENPQYVGSNQRNQQKPSLDRIEEDRRRIKRDINRDDELAVALAEIDKKLESQDTLGAYETRSRLIRTYPLLEANPQLIERTASATDIQRALVADGVLDVQISNQDPTTQSGKNFVLANRSGNSIPRLAGRVAFVKVKGSVYGMDASTGDILWRHYVGRGFETNPIRIGEEAKADVLITQPELGRISRLSGETGETKWVATIGGRIHTPTVESEDLFIATDTGGVASLDLVSGQVKWSKQLPQAVDVAPGAALRKQNLYLPGEHSNLYVLDRRSGECKEVFYLGHEKGSIVVPPMLLQGQLFIFENINNQSARVRVLSLSDEGVELKTAQTAFPMDGNVVVKPQIDRRRLIVQSDLGQIIVLDIEPTAETQKVTNIATVPKSLYEPQIAWAVAGENKLWVADTRFTRFDMQVTLQKMDRAWIRNDGDTFTGPPQLIDDVIIHTRTQRGNQGVRVAAIDAQSGEPFWETDVGVPVVMIAKTGGQFDAVNSAGALFTLDNTPLRSQADADPTQGKPSTLFNNPIWLNVDRAVMFNQSRSNQMAIYTPKQLQTLSANFGIAQPSCPPVAVGDKLAVGLDNGQLVLVDPTNGALAAAPYQPAMEAGKKVVWNQPLFVSGTLIASSNLQKLVRLSTGDALSVLTEISLESPLVGPITQLGKQVAAVQSSKSGDSLALFNATSLAMENSLALEGRLVAGPFVTPEGLVLQTDSKLIAIAQDATSAWSIDFPNSKLISGPQPVGSNWAFVTRDGQVWMVDPQSGTVVANSDAGQALTSEPLVLPSGLLVGSDEGAVLALPIPTATLEGP